MAKVYLPYGYPEISGMEFSNVIYQGTLVRMYDGVEDPRTDAQLYQRRMNSDLAKMRAMLGPWGKGAMRAALGSAWPTVFFQIIKADMDSFWSDAVDDWEGFAEAAKTAWRGVVPYTATFNDYGLIFYAMAKVMMDSLNKFTGHYWTGAAWGDGDSAACLAWWEKDLDTALTTAVYEENDAALEYGGYTARIPQAGASGGYVGRISEALTKFVRVYVKRKVTIFRCWSYYEGGDFEVYLNGELVYSGECNNAVPVQSPTFQIVQDYHNLACIEFRAINLYSWIDYVQVG